MKFISFPSSWFKHNEDTLFMMYWNIPYYWEQKNWKTHKRSLKCNILEEEFLNSSWSIFSKDFAHISYDDASFLILENFIWMHLIYFLTYLKFTYLRLLKNLLHVEFITLISHHGKFVALHKLISIVLQLTNQTK